MTAPAYSARITLLKQFAKSSAHAKAFIDGAMNDPTLSKTLGSGGHALLFGTPEVVVYKGGVLEVEKIKKGKKGKKGQPDIPDTVEVVKKEYTDVRNGALWEQFEEQHAGKVILRQSEYDLAEGMVRALHNSADAAPMLFAPGAKHEHKIEWTFKGRRCTGTIDALSPAAVIDLKCVVDSSPRAFPFQARKYGWHAQAIWYCDGAAAAGLGHRDPYLIAVESQPPHNVMVYRLTDADIRDGRRLYEEWLDKLLECEEANYWPGYADGVHPLNVLNLPVTTVNPWDEEDDELDSSADEAAA